MPIPRTRGGPFDEPVNDPSSIDRYEEKEAEASGAAGRRSYFTQVAKLLYDLEANGLSLDTTARAVLYHAQQEAETETPL